MATPQGASRDRDAILAALNLLLARLTSRVTVIVEIDGNVDQRFRIPAPDDDAPPLADPTARFIPNPFQRAILAALDGHALRTDALGDAVRSRDRLFKTGGLKELKEAGQVQHHHRLGYFRPDAPPPELLN